MLFTAIFGLVSVAAAAAVPSLTSRNAQDDPMLLTWWENGCDVAGDANQSTFVFSDDGPSYPGDCVPTPEYNWQSVKLDQDSGATYSVDLYSGEGCNNFITTVTAESCYTQPEGQIVLSARANHNLEYFAEIAIPMNEWIISSHTVSVMAGDDDRCIPASVYRGIASFNVDGHLLKRAGGGDHEAAMQTLRRHHAAGRCKQKPRSATQTRIVRQNCIKARLVVEEASWQRSFFRGEDLLAGLAADSSVSPCATHGNHGAPGRVRYAVTVVGDAHSEYLGSSVVRTAIQSTFIMFFNNLVAFVATISIAAAAALPHEATSAANNTLAVRNPNTDPFLFAFWEAGCDVEGTGNTQTNSFYDGSPALVDECFANPNYGWQSVKITQDSAASYAVDVFSGVTANGCYTQPQGQLIASAIVRKIK
ncbi:hypothetical protein FH972_026255 [Carpinus fangiana]|uniref:Expansin-like EG45 domain-containing protein n=1 Tax=Carpinus fangiana TaxID=176857 RepID=A0A5N6L3U2_9ROSI|nr:hypothetical protein FH972_026255 [Carpinus fangiana]